MNINTQIYANSVAPGASDPAKRNQMGQQQFLQLLVAQMRHQDPINPLNGAEFAVQLAQFNSVEQLINVNSGIQGLYRSQELMSEGLTNSLAASLTGKNVKAYTPLIYLPAGESANVQFRLNNSASNVEIVIRDASGSEIRRESLENFTAADHQWVWDGRNNNGDRMPDGVYSVSVQATADDDTAVGVLTFAEGLATRVRYTAEGVKLTVNGVEVPIGDVGEVGLPER